MKEFFNKHKSNIIFLLILVGIVIRRCDFEWKQDLEDHFTIPSHSFSRQIYEKDGTLKDMKYITDLFLTYTKDTAWSDLPEFEIVEFEDNVSYVYGTENINDILLAKSYNIQKRSDQNIAIEGKIYLTNDISILKKEYTNIYPALEIFEKAFPEDKEALGEISNSLPEYINTFIDNLSITNEQDFINYDNYYLINIVHDIDDTITYHLSIIKIIKIIK